MYRGRWCIQQAAQGEDPEGQSEDEPEVLDLDNPNFDIRPSDETPADPTPPDQIDCLEFAADEREGRRPSLQER